MAEKRTKNLARSWYGNRGPIDAGIGSVNSTPAHETRFLCCFILACFGRVGKGPKRKGRRLPPKRRKIRQGREAIPKIRFHIRLPSIASPSCELCIEIVNREIVPTAIRPRWRTPKRTNNKVRLRQLLPHTGGRIMNQHALSVIARLFSRLSVHDNSLLLASSVDRERIAINVVRRHHMMW